MYVLARGSRLVPMWLLGLMCVAIPAAPIVSVRPVGIIVAAFVVSILALVGGVLMRASVRKQEIASVSREPGVTRVLEARLTRKSYGALRSVIFERGLYYHAAMRVWVAVGPDAWRIYCVVPTAIGKPFLLATCKHFRAALAGVGAQRRLSRRWTALGCLSLGQLHLAG